MPFRENIGGLQSEQELDEQGLEGALVGASPLSGVSTLSQGALPASSLSTAPTTGPLSQSSSALRFDFNKDPTNAANIQNIANQLLTSGKGLIGTQLDPYALEQLGFAKNPVYSQGEGSDTLTNPSVWSADKKLVGYDNEGNPLYESLGTYSTFANAYDVGNKGTLLGQNITVDDTGKIVNVGLGTSQRGSFLESLSPLLNMAATVVTGGAAGFGLSPLQALAASTALRTLGGADLETLIRNAAATYGINAGLDMASTEIANAAGLDKNLVNKALRTAYGASQSKNPYDLLSAGIRTLASGTGRDILDEYNVTGGPGTQISALDRLSQASDTEADISSDLASRIASAGGLNLSGGLDLTSGEQVAALPLLGIPAIQQGIAAASVLGAHGAALWSALQKAQNPGADIPWTMDYATTVPDYANKPVSDWTEADKQAYIKDFQQSIGKYDTKPLFTTPTNQSLTVQSSRVPSDFKYNEFTQSFPYIDEFGDVKYVSKQDLDIDPNLKWLEEIYFPEPIIIDTTFNVEDPTKTKTTDSGAQTLSSSQTSSEAASLSQALNNALSENQFLESGAAAGVTSNENAIQNALSQITGGSTPGGSTPAGGTTGGETSGGGTPGGGTPSEGGEPQLTQSESMKKLGDELLAQGKSQEEVANELNKQLSDAGSNLRVGFTMVDGEPKTNVYESKAVDRTRSGADYGAIRSGLSQKFGDNRTAAQDLAADINMRMRTVNGKVYNTMEEAIRARNPSDATGPTGDKPKASDYAYQYVFNKVYGRPGTDEELKYARTKSLSELEKDLGGFLSAWKSSQPPTGENIIGDGATEGSATDAKTPANVEIGTSGVSGESGSSGTSGFSGVSGLSGVSGQSGTSGFSGLSGVSGASGFSGVSGESGTSGFSGVSGESGASGFSGFSGESGVSGFSGFSGESGISGWSGVSGESGVSGFSGMSGESGTSGFSGFSGESGTSGFSGYSGASGDSGFSGASGVSGISGFSGFSGDSGVSGFSGYSGVSGVSGFSGASGVSGESGFSGYSGVSGVSGFSGFSGTSGLSGFSGASGVSGESGFSGFSGVSGVSGFSGYSGTSGLSGFSGTSGVSGTSGFSGFSGVSGVSGVSGFSGFSGTAGRDGKSVYAPAAVSSVAAAPAAIDWLGQRMLESKTRGGYRDPLAEFLALQQDIEKESLLKQLQPELANVLAERNAMPYYSYGQEPPIEDVLGLPGGESSSYNESDYVPMFKAGGKVSPLNIQMMYAKGGHTREDFRDGKHVAGPGDGQSDDIPAWLADGEFVFPADVVSALGNGSTKAGTEKLYDMMHEIRARARSSKEKDLPPPAHKSPLDYLKTKKGK